MVSKLSKIIMVYSMIFRNTVAFDNNISNQLGIIRNNWRGSGINVIRILFDLFDLFSSDN